jgi:diaminopimelate epimerase
MRFYKLSGAGNDFLALAEPDRPPAAAEIAAWCRRGLSVGADGLFVLGRRADGAIGMDYFNADGHPAALCLNGTRCAALLAFELGWARDLVRIRTGAGEVTAERAERATGSEIAIDALPPEEAPTAIHLDLLPRGSGGEVEGVDGHRVKVGVPHFVLECAAGLEDAPVSVLGPKIRHHDAFAPAGTNVHFVRYEQNGFDIRSWERGVEAETLACGSGVLAATAVGVALGRLRLPVEARTQGGFTLSVEGEASGASVLRWRLVGDARLLARGELLPGAAGFATHGRW